MLNNLICIDENLKYQRLICSFIKDKFPGLPLNYIEILTDKNSFSIGIPSGTSSAYDSIIEEVSNLSLKEKKYCVKEETNLYELLNELADAKQTDCLAGFRWDSGKHLNVVVPNFSLNYIVIYGFEGALIEKICRRLLKLESKLENIERVIQLSNMELPTKYRNRIFNVFKQKGVDIKIRDIRPMKELGIKTSKIKYNEITDEIDEIVSKLVQEEIRLSEGQLKFIQKFGLNGEYKDSDAIIANVNHQEKVIRITSNRNRANEMKKDIESHLSVACRFLLNEYCIPEENLKENVLNKIVDKNNLKAVVEYKREHQENKKSTKCEINRSQLELNKFSNHFISINSTNEKIAQKVCILLKNMFYDFLIVNNIYKISNLRLIIWHQVCNKLTERYDKYVKCFNLYSYSIEKHENDIYKTQSNDYQIDVSVKCTNSNYIKLTSSINMLIKQCKKDIKEVELKDKNILKYLTRFCKKGDIIIDKNDYEKFFNLHHCEVFSSNKAIFAYVAESKIEKLEKRIAKTCSKLDQLKMSQQLNEPVYNRFMEFEEDERQDFIKQIKNEIKEEHKGDNRIKF